MSEKKMGKIIILFCITLILLSGCLSTNLTVYNPRSNKQIAAEEFCPNYEVDSGFVWANYYCPSGHNTAREFNCILREGKYKCFYLTG